LQLSFRSRRRAGDRVDRLGIRVEARSIAEFVGENERPPPSAEPFANLEERVASEIRALEWGNMPRLWGKAGHFCADQRSGRSALQ